MKQLFAVPGAFTYLIILGYLVLVTLFFFKIIGNFQQHKISLISYIFYSLMLIALPVIGPLIIYLKFYLNSISNNAWATGD
jgi:hypothetical protein